MKQIYFSFQIINFLFIFWLKVQVWVSLAVNSQWFFFLPSREKCLRWCVLLATTWESFSLVCLFNEIYPFVILVLWEECSERFPVGWRESLKFVSWILSLKPMEAEVCWVWKLPHSKIQFWYSLSLWVCSICHWLGSVICSKRFFFNVFLSFSCLSHFLVSI